MRDDGTRNETLWDLTRGERLRYGGAILALCGSAALLFGVPLVVQAAIDGVIAGGESAAQGGAGVLAGLGVELADALGRNGALWAAAGALVLLTALAGVCQYAQGRWAAESSESIAARLRSALYAHLLRIPSAWLDRADTGDVVQRCTSDVETVRAFLATQVVEIGRTVLPLAIALPLMLWLDVRMTLVSLAGFPLVLCFSVVFFRRVQSLFLAMDEAEARMTTVLQENLTGIRVVRAFGRQEHETAKFAVRNAEFRDRAYRLIRLLGVYWPAVDLLSLAQLGAVLFLSAARVRAGTLSVGELFAFTTYVSLLIMPWRVLGRVLTEAGKATVSLRRVGEILAVPLEPGGAGAGEVPERPLSGAIEVRGLSFAYPGGPDVLRGLSFEVAAGETIALLGPPGSGKSTLVQLLLRLYDYDRGSIRLDGIELAGLERGYARAQVAAVLQEPFLYSRTIRRNVLVGRGEATDEEVRRAASEACLHDTIQSFPDGYETVIGERGVTLSGGQRQRLAIARAFVSRAPILVLDDASSAVDTRTEARILEALRARRGRTTTILVTHRLSTAALADRVLVLEHGRLAQSGTHAELVASEGAYRRLWRVQDELEHEIDRAEELALGAPEGKA